MIIRHSFLPALALLAAACSAAPQAAASGDVAAPRTIAVTGIGEAAAAPDMAVLNLGVQTQGATAAEALRQNSMQMRATIETLEELGIEERDIQTSGLMVNPRYDYERNNANPPLIGFTASNTASVKLRDLEKAGEVIDEAVRSGANSLSGISFDFADPEPLHERARRDAVAKAQAKAAVLSEAAGVRLGPILSIREGHAPAPGPMPALMRMETAAADVFAPIRRGESTVTATVTIIYEIQ